MNRELITAGLAGAGLFALLLWLSAPAPVPEDRRLVVNPARDQVRWRLL